MTIIILPAISKIATLSVQGFKLYATHFRVDNFNLKRR